MKNKPIGFGYFWTIGKKLDVENHPSCCHLMYEGA